MKALFVGLGGVGQRHLRNLSSLIGDGLEVLAYRTRGSTKEITNTLQLDGDVDINERYGIQVFSSLSEALGQRPDAVFICNPTSLHMPVALEAAKSGCHLFIEKALSNSMAGVQELIDITRDKNLIGVVAYQMRFNPCLNLLREKLEAGAIGRVVSLSAEVGEYMPGWHKYEDYRGIYAAKKDLGGGVILSQIHEFDYILWLLGMPKSVYATGGKLSDLDIDVEDVASISMTVHKDDINVPVHLHQDYLQKPVSRGCKIIGTNGRIVVSLSDLTLTHYGPDGEIIEHRDFTGFDRNQQFIDEMKHFLACIERREEPKVSIADGARSLAMALAAKESLNTGTVVQMAEFYGINDHA